MNNQLFSLLAICVWGLVMGGGFCLMQSLVGRRKETETESVTDALPELPDGWEWTGDSQSRRALTDGTAVATAGRSICVATTNVADGFGATVIPTEVILAVLRANGHNFTS